MQKGVSLFLSYTNMNKMNSLHHMKEHPKISNILQFESHSSNCEATVVKIWKNNPRPDQPRFHVLHTL